MADRGIIFSAPMLRALLEGRKTQTRRLVNTNSRAADALFNSGFTDAYIMDPGNAEWRARAVSHRSGDRLYVREHWKVDNGFDHIAPRDLLDCYDFDHVVCYLGTAPAESLRDPVWGRHRQAMHMPRWASRLTLTVTDVRVQRLQEISEEDAAAEGANAVDLQHSPSLSNAHRIDLAGIKSHREGFAQLWDSLHADPGTRWEDNPWITAISFTVEHGNIDHIGGR